MNHCYARSLIYPNAPMRLLIAGFCTCNASLHHIPVNHRRDFLYEIATAFEHQKATRKAPKTTRNSGGAA